MFKKVVDVWRTAWAHVWIDIFKLFFLKGSEYDHTTPAHNRPKQYEPDGQIGDIDNPLDAPVADGIFELDVPLPLPHTDHPVGNPFFNKHGGCR